MLANKYFVKGRDCLISGWLWLLGIPVSLCKVFISLQILTIKYNFALKSNMSYCLKLWHLQFFACNFINISLSKVLVTFWSIAVSCGMLIKQAIVQETKAGMAARTYTEHHSLGMWQDCKHIPAWLLIIDKFSGRIGWVLGELAWQIRLILRLAPRRILDESQ